MFEIRLFFNEYPCNCGASYNFHISGNRDFIELSVRCKKCNVSINQLLSNTKASIDLIKNIEKNKNNIRLTANILENTVEKLQVALDKLEAEGKL